MNLDLTGRKAIVCGSTQGMGRATAEELVSLGATVTLVARNEESLTAVRDSLAGDGHQAVCADFGDQDMLKERINSHVQRHGPFHILVNNPEPWRLEHHARRGGELGEDALSGSGAVRDYGEQCPPRHDQHGAAARAVL